MLRLAGHPPKAPIKSIGERGTHVCVCGATSTRTHPSASGRATGYRPVKKHQFFLWDSEAYTFPDLDLLKDSANNRIGNACLTGATRSDLGKLGIPDIEARLQKLLAAHVLLAKDNKYFLGIPVIIGNSGTGLHPFQKVSVPVFPQSSSSQRISGNPVG